MDPASHASSWAPSRAHLSRLMKIWRSAGWPCRDPIELDLLAAGLIAAHTDPDGRDTLRLSTSGLAALIASRQRNLRAMSRHERLAQRVARQLADAGRLVWLELALRAHVSAHASAPVQATADPALTAAEPLPDLGLWPAEASASAPSPEPKGAWRMARPDVFSVRHTSVEAYLQPVVHEIKVSRADLLSDLRHAVKRESYQWLCSACYYVFPAGIAKPNEIPEEFGIWLVHGDIDSGQLEQVRPARHVSRPLPFPVWMALAKSTPWRPDELAEAQAHLGEPGATGPGPQTDAPSQPDQPKA
ncbi:MAG: hypothetical protein HY019_05155 [Aquabacterium sp.]|uniref:hypothetical protein n=1 Tax=Aquabacterium sp. TaxID=1872578 RepID=UPI0025BE583F|nr:hypothetical protein [Aquabacterium sp.]MBI3381379.1 hypothetical protein [Aquabacterium sp.]